MEGEPLYIEETLPGGRWLATRRFFLIVLGLFACLQVGMLVGRFSAGPFRFLSKAVIWPAAMVDGQFVSYSSVVERSYGITAADLEFGRRRSVALALGAALRDAQLRALAERYDVGVGNDDGSADSDAARAFQGKAGWSRDQYHRFFVEPRLLFTSLERAVPGQSASRDIALEDLGQLRARIMEDMPFVEAAKVFSDDRSALIGGDQGMVSVADLAPWQSALTDAEVGDVSQVLSGPDGAWIYLVYERGEDWLRLYGIRHRYPSLSEILREYRVEKRPWVFVW